MYKCPVCDQVFPHKQDHYDKRGFPCNPVARKIIRRRLKELRRALSLVALAKKETKMNFALSEDDVQKLNNWLKEHDKTCPFIKQKHQPAIGGRLTYSFKPTSLGNFVEVKCVCGAKEYLTELDNL